MMFHQWGSRVMTRISRWGRSRQWITMLPSGSLSPWLLWLLIRAHPVFSEDSHSWRRASFEAPEVEVPGWAISTASGWEGKGKKSPAARGLSWSQNRSPFETSRWIPCSALSIGWGSPPTMRGPSKLLFGEKGSSAGMDKEGRGIKGKYQCLLSPGDSFGVIVMRIKISTALVL